MSRPSHLSDNVAGALCYLAMPLSALALLLLAPYSGRSFVRFHAIQAVLTFGALVLLTIAMRIFAGLFFLIPFVGRLILGLSLATLWVGFLALWILLMYRALEGKRYRLPFIGARAARHAA